MLVEFIDFVDSVLPSVSPDLKDEAKAAILQFERDGRRLNYLTNNPLCELSQGDIISNIPFTYFAEDGKQQIFQADAMVISTSCHIDQKNKMVLAPVFPLSSFSGDQAALEKNTIFDYMYIPDAQTADKFVDFSFFCTYSKDLIMQGIGKEHIKRIASLNQVGYYFFVVKLTVYLMRKEDAGTLNERRQDMIAI